MSKIRPTLLKVGTTVPQTITVNGHKIGLIRIPSATSSSMLNLLVDFRSIDPKLLYDQIDANGSTVKFAHSTTMYWQIKGATISTNYRGSVFHHTVASWEEAKEVTVINNQYARGAMVSNRNGVRTYRIGRLI